jgi:hypothetical protein
LLKWFNLEKPSQKKQQKTAAAGIFCQPPLFFLSEW